MKKEKNKTLSRQKKIIIGLISILVLVSAGFAYYLINERNIFLNTLETKIIASDEPTAMAYFDLEEMDNPIEIVRGTAVSSHLYEEEINGSIYKHIVVDLEGVDTRVWIPVTNLVNEGDNVILESEIYIRTTTHLFTDIIDGDFVTIARKGEKLDVIGGEIDLTGTAIWYEVRSGENTGYVRSKYVVSSEEEALAVYDPKGYFKSQKEDLTFLDYFPREKENYPSNPRQDEAYSFYLSDIKDIDDHIKIAKQTNVNTFVIDIKESYHILYESDVVKEYSPSMYKTAQYSKDKFAQAIKKLHDEGFYVIGRIVVFKDPMYSKDHEESSIYDLRYNKPFNRGGEIFVSAFDRDVWKYNVELAKESVHLFGFNEIQLDYIRFIDRTQDLDRQNLLDYHNEYGEHKAEAIQRFAMYAYDELSDLNVYLSADVFGEVGYVTIPSGMSYGQQWHAISNVVDFISPMVYPDHYDSTFTNGREPYLYPYELVYRVSKISNDMNKEIPTPAGIRTWIQAYDPYKVEGIRYGSKEFEAQIQALYDAGLKGFMPWNPWHDIRKYNGRLDAFKKTYQ